jgi:hypothetical protein
VKLFLSWSGEFSHSVAAALHQWLPYMIQPVQPVLSSDISKGERWGEVLAQELKDAEYGIICVTPYNLSKPWMNFEAGALTRFIDKACVTPFLFRVDRSCVTGPLAQFQSAVSDEGDVLNLIYSINNRLGPAKLDQELLRRTFDVWWKELKKTLDDIAPSAQEETRTVYNWLYTFDDLAIHEGNADNKSIWIITSDIVKHATGNNVRQKVTENIKKGVEYRYFVPNGTDDTDLKAMRVSSHPTLDYKVFDNELFDTQAVTDYVIINADSTPLRMLLKLPIEDGEYWIKVDERSARNLTTRFRKLWEGPNIAPNRSS